MNKEKLYIAQEDLYRFGNLTSPRMSHIRPKDAQTVNINGIETIVANGSGVSLFNKEGLDGTHLTGWIWEIQKGTSFPVGLKLVKDTKGAIGHHLLVPAHTMPLSQYIGLLEQVAIRCKKILKKQA